MTARPPIEKAVVLCAGEGSRLRPLTFSRPKHLLPVAGTPILGWALKALQESGIRQVALVVGHQADAIRRYVGAGDAWGLNVRYIPQFRPLGIGHAVSLARDFVEEHPFIVYLGDNLFLEGVTEFVSSLDGAQWDAGLLLKRVPDPSRFGVAQVQDEHVVRVVEKPQDPPSDLAIVGVYAFGPAIFEAINSLAPSDRGELEITDAIQALLEGGARVRCSEATGVWEDTGEPAALLKANRQWLVSQQAHITPGTTYECRVEGHVSIGQGTRVSNSQVIGPCRIGSNCIVRDAIVGPDVTIDEGCTVEAARLQNCIVQRNCQIRHLGDSLVDSVLGEQVEIQGRPGKPHGVPLSLLLGDMGRVKAM